MRHLTEYQLIEHYYGESDSAQVVAHLKECTECEQAYTTLKRDLAEIPTATPPTHDSNYGAQVWQSIRASLPVYEQEKKKSWFAAHLWQTLSYASACLVLLAAAFVAGRHWERSNGTPQQQPVAAVADNKARERVVLLVLGDHLDRSERLLVELRHGEAGAPLQDEARDLLSANRLYRQSAAEANDPELANALERLERVLVEIANQPEGLTPARAEELQKQMNTDGLLFEVRVLRSRVQGDEQQQQGTTTAGSKGVSI